MHSRLSAALACLALLAVPSAGQQLWVVDDDGGAGVDFTDVQAAVNAAQSGDALLVRDGTYAGFTIDGKALTVVASGAGAAVQATSVSAPLVRIANLTETQTVLLQGLAITNVPTSFPFLGSAVRVDDCRGEVWIESCALRGGRLSNGALYAANSDSVVLARSTARGEDAFSAGSGSSGSAGAVVLVSAVRIYDSELEGGTGGGGGCHEFACNSGARGGYGLYAVSGHAFVSGSLLQGGDGLPAEGALLPCPPFAPVGGEGGDGGHGLLVAFQASVELLDCQLLGGDFGAGGPSCPDGLPGAAQSVAPAATFVTHAGTARGVAATSPVSEGGPTTVSLAGEAGDLVFLIIAFDTDDSLALPGFIGPGLLTFPLFLVELGFLPATGKLDLFLTVGSLAPGLEFRALYFQPIHLSAGLVLYVGGPTAMVVTGA